MKELQDHAKRLQRENDRFRAQVEKRRDLGGRDVQDSSRALHPVPHNRGKEPIIPDEADAPADDELSSGSSPPLGLLLTKNTRARSHKRTLHRPTFSDAVSGASHRVRREAGRGVEPTRLSPPRHVSISWGRDAINVVCTSRLRYRVDILHAISSSNPRTRRHAVLTLTTTHS